MRFATVTDTNINKKRLINLDSVKLYKLDEERPIRTAIVFDRVFKDGFPETFIAKETPEEIIAASF